MGAFQKRRWLFALLAFCLLFCAVPASALSDPVTVQPIIAGEGTIPQGGRFSVQVVAKDADKSLQGLAGMLLDLTYNPAEVQVVSATPGTIPDSIAEVNTEYAEGKIRFAFVNASLDPALPADTVLLTVQFQALDTVEVDSAISFQVEVIEAYKLDDAATPGGFTSIESTSIDGQGQVVELTYLLGDVDEDGYITAIDARYVLQTTTMLRELSSNQQLAADVDGDAFITAIDARWILQRTVFLRDENFSLI